MILLRHGETVFNVVYGATRRDPGVPDPILTEQGREQAAAAATALAGETVARVVASPYTRAIQTADVIARSLDVPLVIDETIRERFAFSCDVGTPRSVLQMRWSAYAFDHIEDVWWPDQEEPEEEFHVRCDAFRRRMAESDDWRGVAVVTHWGVIRSLTGLRVKNGEMLRFDPADDPGRSAGDDATLVARRGSE